MTQTDRTRAMALRMEGQTCARIASQFGVSEGYIHQLVRHLRPLYLPPELHQAILEESARLDISPADYLAVIAPSP